MNLYHCRSNFLANQCLTVICAMNKKDKLVAKKHRKAIARMKAKKKAAIEQAQSKKKSK